MRHLLIAVAALSVAATGTAATLKSTPHHSYTGEELAKDAVVKMDAARSAALKARPGTVTDAELEKESGGSGLRYSFDIKSGGKTYEVGIDAKTGAILENKAEGKNPV